MFKKLINKIIMGTKCYLTLKKELEETQKINDELYPKVEKATKIARKIIRAINKKDEKLAKQLCKQIIKGE